MTAEPDTVNLGSMFDAQKDRLDDAIEVLEESRDDVKCEWLKQEFDNVAEALRERRAMH